MTFGQRVFFAKGGWSDYLAKKVEGISLAGHEVRHTIQYSELGVVGFLGRYIWQAIRYGGDPLKMPLEKVAYDDQDRITEILRSSTELLQSIQNGTYGITTGTYSLKDQPVDPGVFGGLSFLSEWGGTLWIDGVNLTGVMTYSSPRL